MKVVTVKKERKTRKTKAPESAFKSSLNTAFVFQSYTNRKHLFGDRHFKFMSKTPKNNRSDE